MSDAWAWTEALGFTGKFKGRSLRVAVKKCRAEAHWFGPPTQPCREGVGPGRYLSAFPPSACSSPQAMRSNSPSSGISVGDEKRRLYRSFSLIERIAPTGKTWAAAAQ